MPCYFPFKKDTQPLPCGKCPYCLSRRANNWVFRTMQHAKVAQSSLWVTLTYEQPNMTEKNFMTLSKKSLQNFFKRLRKLYPPTQEIKYYACGEYGSKTQRPHYHAIIFNCDKEEIEKAWKGTFISVSQQTGEISTVINGDVYFDVLNENTAMYTAKYINKPHKIPAFKGDDRLKEFQLFSKKLGLNYLTPQTIKFHQEDISRLYVTVQGHKKALPRYFRLKIYDEEQRLKQAELAQAQSEQTYQLQYDEYLKSRSKGQTFEEFRFSRKNNALKNFRKETSKRDKL